MSPSDQLSQRVAAYLKDEMTAADRQAFEAELLENAELKQEFDFQEAMILGLMLKGGGQMQAAPPTTNSAPSPDAGNPLASRKWLLRIAAVLIPLIVFGLWWLTLQNQPRELDPLKELAMSQEYANSSTLSASRGAGDRPYQYFLEGISHLRNHSFEAAEQTFAQFSPEDSLYYADAQFHLAKAYLGQGRPKEAQKIFDETEQRIAAGVPFADTYQSQLRWFRALAHLQLGEKEAAKSLLEENVAAEEKFKPDESQKLLEDIGRI